MLELIGIITVVIGVIYLAPKLFTGKNMAKLSESEIVKRFNSLAKKINERNLETIKAEMLILLKQFKIIKIEQFAETKTLLLKSHNTLDSSLNTISGNIAKVKNTARNLPSYEEKKGALLVYQIDKLTEMQDKISKAIEDIKNKLIVIDDRIDRFNADYALKEASIHIMVADSIAIQNISDIDIKLDDLAVEFEDKVTELKTRNEVRDRVNGVEVDTYDESIYIEKFKNFIK